MTNKIVILDDSVILHEHYISDNKWERTMAFPRGGLTYLISNGTIKFYAYEDYFYRNCLISMQLPIYIVDEYMHIDGEYENVEDLIDVLDRIFPRNDIDAELSKYLKIIDAELLYQPIGDYLTKAVADTLYMPIGDYVTDEELVEVLEDYYTKNEVYSKTECDNKYQDKLIAGANITISGNVISAAGGSTPTDGYTKAEADARFQPKGDYISETDLENELNKYVTKTWITNQNYVTNNTLNVYITNLQEQIDSLQEALEKCCSGTPTPTPITEYRWITLTGASDFICVGTTKYEKQQKQQSTDGGITWENVVPAEYQRGNQIETSSVDCGAAPEITDRRWVDVENEYICKDYSKYKKKKLQWSYDNGVTWVDSNPLKTTEGTLIESFSRDCGYDGCKYAATVYLSGNNEAQYPSTEVEYYNGEFNRYTTNQGWWYNNSSAITSVTLNECVTSIGDNTFKAMDGYHNYTKLAYVDLPATVTSIGLEAFKTKNLGVCNLKTVIIRTTTPPSMSAAYEYFSTDGGLKIYVPDEAVDTYKTAEGWRTRYADRIYPISELNS